MNLPNDPAANAGESIIPTVRVEGQHEAALERKTRYTFRFPRDTRPLGGKFTVKENARRLLRFFYFERRLVQGLGAWTLTIPEFELKLETGHHIFFHANAARFLHLKVAAAP